MPESNESSPSPPRCPVCRSLLPAGALGGSCARCLLSLAAASSLAAEIDDDLLEPGQVRTLGGYQLLEEIARGGMGIVYRARQLNLGREVAVKMILTGQLATTESVQRFRNEAATAARLDHRNIVSVYEIGEYETQHYFSMRLVLGRRNIAGWARALAGTPTERGRAIATMLARTARAVAFAHERGVLHRDLKPSNILVDEQGEPQVTDFGLAKLLHEQDSGLTLSAAVLGSPGYMAPEQIDERRRDLTTAADIYGLGAVLYEMLTQRPPFTGASPLITARKVIEEMPTRLVGVPRDLETICLRCLAKEPAQRYPTALALAEDCERFARGEPIRARPLTTPEALWRWARRRPKIAALSAVTLLAFVLGFVGVSWQWLRAERARVAEEHAVNHLRWLEIMGEANSEKAPIAMAKIAALLRADPHRWQAATLAMSVIDQKAFPALAGPPVTPAAKLVSPPALAPDGRSFATAAEDGTVRIWDIATGRELEKIDAHATALAVAQGPVTLAFATSDGKVLVRPGAALPRMFADPIDELRFSTDGSVLAGWSRHHLEFWKTAALSEPPVTVEFNGDITHCVLTAAGTRALAWSSDRATVWDTASGRALVDATPRAFFKTAAISPDGRRLAAVDDSMYAVRCWDVDAGAPLNPPGFACESIHSLAFNADGSRLTLAGTSNDAFVWDPVAGSPVSLPMRHLYSPVQLASSGDGRQVATQALDGRTCVWDATTGHLIFGAIWLDSGDADMALRLSQDGATVLLYPEKLHGDPGAISVWRCTQTSPPQRRSINGARIITTTALSPDNRFAAFGYEINYGVEVFEVATGRAVIHAPTAMDVDTHYFSPDSRRYYALSRDGTVCAWSLETGQVLWTSADRTSEVWSAAMSPDGTRIVIGRKDNVSTIIDTANGATVCTFDAPTKVRVVRFAPDGSGRFLTASSRGDVAIWQVATGQKLLDLSGHTDGVLTGDWSPDGTLVATGSADYTARVWDSATGQPACPPLQHLSMISHLEFTPDGRRLLTGSRDATVRFWDPRSGRPLSPPLPQAAPVANVCFTQDGQRFLVRDHEGFQFWDANGLEPVTIHYFDPLVSGTSNDNESLRAFMSPDGTLVNLGMNMSHLSVWRVAQPHAVVPDWFPDLLETLALMRLEPNGSTRIMPGNGIVKLKDRIRAAGDDPYAVWARRVLGEK